LFGERKTDNITGSCPAGFVHVTMLCVLKKNSAISVNKKVKKDQTNF